MRVVVIGTGAGGAAAGYALAKSGHEVIFVERGASLTPPALGRDEGAMHLDRVARDIRAKTMNGREARVVSPSLPGGGTALYGAALVRPSPEEFQPGRHMPTYLPHEVWDWAVPFEALEKHFDEVEDLLGVAGNHLEAMPYLSKRALPYSEAPLPFLPENELIKEYLSARGLHPFSLPVAVDHQTCLHCAACPGYLCPTGSRRGASTLLARAVHNYGTRIFTGMEALTLIAGGDGRIRTVRLGEVGKSATFRLKADAFVVAGGAIGTPSLLDRSGLEDKSGQRGRNYMMHLGVGIALISRRPRDITQKWHKQIGLSDFLFGVQACPEKLGMVQSLPIPGPLTLAKKMKLPRRWADGLHHRLMSFVGTVDDLPQLSNRVITRRDGIHVEHHFNRDDLRRGRGLLRAMKQAFSGAGAWQVGGFVGKKEHPHNAHQVGTCRMHHSAKHGVVDPWGRVHGYDNLFVADGSVFPTALGVGPALTTFAWGLRVAEGMGAATPAHGKEEIFSPLVPEMATNPAQLAAV